MELNTFFKDLIIACAPALIALTTQHLAWVKPLKKRNKYLNDKLNGYSIDLIDEHISRLKQEQQDNVDTLPFLFEEQSKLEDSWQGGSEEQYWDYLSELNDIKEQISVAQNRIKEIPIEILNFIDKYNKKQ